MYPLLKSLGLVFVFSLSLLSCGEKPIGQPCSFSRPQTANTDDSGVTTTIDCTAYPKCHPLQQAVNGEVVFNQPGNACPMDCIVTLSLECDYFYCVATQIDNDNEHISNNGHLVF